jgi:putative ABC transport system substrate-binding protein
MRRRDFIAGLGGAAAWPLVARAQQLNTAKRVVWLTQDLRGAQEQIPVFRGALSKLGWREGENIHVDVRVYRDNPPIAAEVVATTPDVIFCAGTTTTALLHRLTSTIPIVFVNVADPLASGFVASFARPGGNITGFTSVAFSFAGKWLSVLKDVAPGLVRVLVLYDPSNPNRTGYQPVIEAAAAAFGVNVTGAPITTLADAEQATETFAREPGSGMVVLPAVMIGNRDMLTALATRHRLPAIYPYDVYVESGGLVSYGSNSSDLYRQAATYISRILKGERAAELPVQAPVKFELVINLNAAKAIGLDIPYNMLVLADRLIE